MATGAVRLATQHRMQRRALATTTVPPSTVPPSEIARLLHAHRHRLTRGVAQFSPDTVFERASGVYLYDALSGRRFLDFGSGMCDVVVL